MKRTLIGAGIILILFFLGWVGATFVYSAMTEEGFTLMTEEFNEASGQEIPGAEMEMRIDRFEKGLITSKAWTTIAFVRSTESSSDEVGIELEHTIYHGPLAMTPDGAIPCSAFVHTTLIESEDEKTREMIEKAFEGRDPVILKTTTDFVGGSEIHYEIAPFKLNSDSIQSEFEGASGVLTITNDGKKAEGQGSLQKIDIKAVGENNNFESTYSPITYTLSYNEESHLDFVADLGAITMKSQAEEGPNHFETGPGTVRFNMIPYGEGETPLWLGDGEIRFETATFGIGVEKLTAYEVSFGVESEVSDGIVGGSYLLNVERMDVPQSIQMTMPVDLSQGLSMEMGGDGFEETTIQKMTKLTEEMNAARVAGGEADPEEQERYVVEMADTVMAMLVPGMELFVKATIGSDDRLTGDIRLGLVGDRPLTEHQTIGGLLDAVKADVDVVVSKKVISEEMAPLMLATPLQMGLVADGGDHWKMDASLSKGQLMVNGQVSPLTQMMLPPEAREAPMDWSAFRQGVIMGIKQRNQMQAE